MYPTTNNTASAEMRIPIENEDVLECNEYFNITLHTSETRVMIANGTSVIIVNDDGKLHNMCILYSILNMTACISAVLVCMCNIAYSCDI